LAARLKLRERKLQMLPAVAVEAMRLAKDPNCSIPQFAAVVERDVKLATDILRISNSALYSPTVPIKSLRQAVVRLGLDGCQNLILTSSIASLMKRVSEEQVRVSTVLWQHSYDTGTLAQQLNATFRFGFKGEEFAAGLIHDFGRILLAIAEPEKFADGDPMDFIETPEKLAHEDEVLGTDHCRLGGWYAASQHLPPPFPEVMLCHHEPETSKNHQHLTALVAVADHMSNHMQRYKMVAGYDPGSNPFLPFLAKFGDAHFETKFADVASKLMETAMADLETIKTVFTSSES
jgi:HD-like signal output (HDOD) protein